MKPAFNCKSVFVALACMMASIVLSNNAARAAQKTSPLTPRIASSASPQWATRPAPA
ncbi:MAG: hypothetical protein ABI210_08700 [Abditibacteriaceae bacterium]